MNNEPQKLRRSTRQISAPQRFTGTIVTIQRTRTYQKRKTANVKDEEKSKREARKKTDSDVESSDLDHKSDGHEGLSAYELERLENIKENKAFLSSMNLYQITEELRQRTPSKPSSRGLKRLKSPAKTIIVPRKSLRLQNKSAEIVSPSPKCTAVLTLEQAPTFKNPPGPLPMAAINMEEGSRLPSQLVKLCTKDFAKEKKVQPDLKNYCSALKTMRITEENVAKVVKDRIFSAAFHPCTSSLLMAAGDRKGQVGLWNLGGDWGDGGVLLFEPHTRPVTCMAFSRVQPTHLLSLSYDGSLRCMDVEKAVFDNVYDVEDGLTTFDFMSHDCMTLVVGDCYGEVTIVDRRTPGNSYESLHKLNTKNVRCVNVHPIHKQHFAVAETNVVSIYDSRCLKKTNSQPVCQLHGHSLSIPSAYFSPSTGNRVVTTCMDNMVRMYDTSTLTTNPPLLTSIRKNMQTGRWVSKLSAMWDPKKEDCFVMGSLAKPRKVLVYHESGKLLHSFASYHITTVLSVTAFHPTRHALLGGNASGRLHVITD
ncbi:hypothetical protein LDENG_00108290 [Lucifuga dentata]|nr:hypothetical protein LDENG_00108290 [Lucifuga dentata]